MTSWRWLWRRLAVQYVVSHPRSRATRRLWSLTFAATARVLTDPGLHERLATAGLERPAQFTWERTARGTLETWRRALDG